LNIGTEKLLAFIREHLASNPEQVTSIDQSLIRTGIIDSFALVELATFIEEEFGVSVPDPEMNVDNFDTVALSMSTIYRHLGAKP
jgi:acyl carrier protein